MHDHLDGVKQKNILRGEGKLASCFSAKAAKESANGQPASPMDTWTAERPFARKMILTRL